MPRLQQRGELLVEHEQFLPADAAPMAVRHAERGQDAPALQRQHEQPFVLELAAEMRLAVGDVDAFGDFPAGGSDPTAEFHWNNY